jgi:predicted ArsR family transcriptional regulator
VKPADYSRETTKRQFIMQIFICIIGIITGMKPTTRLRILDHIRKYQTASVRELSQVMGMTGANIRHHLAVLEMNDLIEVVAKRQDGRGRPLQVYGMSRRVLGDGLDNLSGALLDVWLGGGKVGVADAALRSVAERLAGLFDFKMSLVRRLTQAVTRLNELRYQARWEASGAGPRIILGHCPYAAIIAAHPELCKVDALLLEMRLGSHVEQTAKLQLSEKGLPFCAFVLVAK